jgi:hypothetical protein
MRVHQTFALPVAVLASSLLFSGCVNGYVGRGMAWGALAGAAIGAGTGVLISDDSLLGASKSADRGDIALAPGDAIGAGLVIGVITGAVVGAMVGHRRDEGYERPPKPDEASAPAPSASETPAEAPKEAARASRVQVERSPYFQNL